MNTSRKLFAGVVLAGLTLAVPARAEVAAETNVFGNYVRTVIYAGASARHPRIWSVTRMRLGFTPLNPRGDATGDLLPVVAENPAQQGWPLAVWSRFNGLNYDLVWSRWEGRSWSPIAAVEEGPSPFDAIDPVIAFNANGRAHMVWMSQDDSSSTVYLSIFQGGKWMSPYRVSDPGELAIRPAIEVLADGSVLASYDTSTLHVVKTIIFAVPTTITDDLNPFGTGATTTATSTTDTSGASVDDKK
jgi:hypothetical protein